MELQRPLVLVADDDPDMRALLRRLLERAGFRVELVADGAAALARLEGGGVDLVLVDLMMPQVDGLEFCRRVRESEQTQHVPIIMLTGSVNAADRRAGFALGVDDYLLKPFATQAVIERVRAWIHAEPHPRGPSEESLVPQAPAPEPALTPMEPIREHAPPMVLVVDDDPAVRELLVELLSGAGYRVQAVTQGQAALQSRPEPRLPADTPGLILLDLGIPDGDGIAVLQELTVPGSTVPVVTMSDRTTLLADAQAAGARATLTKPLDLLQLADLLERYCPIQNDRAV